MKKLARWLESTLSSEQFTYKAIKDMFVPLVVDQLFIFIIGMLSVAMVSSSGEQAMAAVSLVGSLGYIVSGLFTALGTGGAIVVAQLKGAGDALSVRKAAGQTIGLCAAAALVMDVIFIGMADGVVRTIYPKAEPVLIEYAIHYLQVYSLSYLPYAVYFAIFNTYRSIGETKSSLLMSVVINTAYLICSVLFVGVLKMGVTGAGLAFLVARVIGAALAWVWMFKVRNVTGIRFADVTRFTKDIVSRIMNLGVPFAAEQLLFQAGALIAQVYLATLTTTDLAAHGVATSLTSLYYATAYSLTSLTTTVCGQAYGARNIALVRRYCAAFVKVGRLVMLVTVVLLLPLTPLLMLLYSPTAEATPIIWQALLITALPMPLLWCDAYVTPAALRACGDAKYTTVVSLLAMWICHVGAGYVLAIPLGLGVPGVWLGTALEWAVRALVLPARIKGHHWVRVHE